MPRRADLVGVLEHLGPLCVRSVVGDMAHVGVLTIYLQAAIQFMVTSPEVVRLVRSHADALLAQKSWSLPDHVGRPAQARKRRWCLQANGTRVVGVMLPPSGNGSSPRRRIR